MTEPQSDRPGGDGLRFNACSSCRSHHSCEQTGGCLFHPRATRDAAEGAGEPTSAFAVMADHFGMKRVAPPKPAPDPAVAPDRVREWDEDRGAYFLQDVPAPDAVREALLKRTVEFIQANDPFGDAFSEHDLKLFRGESLMTDKADTASEPCSQAGAAEPDIKCSYCNGTGKVELTIGERNALSDIEMRDALQKSATPPVRGDREAIARLLASFDGNCFEGVLGVVIQEHDKEAYRKRADRILSLPVQPGAGERGAIQRARHYIANRFTNDSKDAGKQIVDELDAILSIHRTTVPASKAERDFDMGETLLSGTVAMIRAMGFDSAMAQNLIEIVKISYEAGYKAGADDALVAQRIEQGSSKPEVAGSSPAERASPTSSPTRSPVE